MIKKCSVATEVSPESRENVVSEAGDTAVRDAAGCAADGHCATADQLPHRDSSDITGPISDGF